MTTESKLPQLTTEEQLFVSKLLLQLSEGRLVIANTQSNMSKVQGQILGFLNKVVETAGCDPTTIDFDAQNLVFVEVKPPTPAVAPTTQPANEA